MNVYFKCGLRRGSYLFVLIDCFLLRYLFWSYKVLLILLKFKVCRNVKNEYIFLIICIFLINFSNFWKIILYFVLFCVSYVV